jgi:hypothetical protein
VSPWFIDQVSLGVGMMANDSGKRTVTVGVDQLAGLAVEHWRLSAAVGSSPAAPVRHALRKIGDFLSGCGVEVRGLDGQPYDAGLAARVVDTVADAALPRGTAVVKETLSPMVLHGGVVARAAEVVVGEN